MTKLLKGSMWSSNYSDLWSRYKRLRSKQFWEAISVGSRLTGFVLTPVPQAKIFVGTFYITASYTGDKGVNEIILELMNRSQLHVCEPDASFTYPDV